MKSGCAHSRSRFNQAGATQHQLYARSQMVNAPVVLVLAFFMLVTAGSAISTEIQNAQGSSQAVFSPSCQAAAQGSPKIMQALEAISVRPSAGAYDRLGAAFAEQKVVGCAVESYRAAVRLDPGLWLTRYYLALALISEGENQRPLRNYSVRSHRSRISSRRMELWVWRSRT